MLISIERSAAMGEKLLNSTNKVNAQKAKYALQQAKCVVKDVNFHVNNYCFRHKTLKFNELS